jgi:hypothetical protein
MSARSLSRIRVLVSAVVAVGLFGTGAATATTQAPTQVVYVGSTSQRQPIAFLVVVTERGTFIPDFQFTVVQRCELSGEVLVGTLGFGGFRVRVQNGQFRFDFVDLDVAIHWSGSVSPKAAAGLLSVSTPAFTPKEELQACPTGTQTWTASPTALSSVPSGEGDVRITYTRSSDGRIHRTEERG